MKPIIYAPAQARSAAKSRYHPPQHSSKESQVLTGKTQEFALPLKWTSLRSHLLQPSHCLRTMVATRASEFNFETTAKAPKNWEQGAKPFPNKLSQTPTLKLTILLPALEVITLRNSARTS
jgi:hypothetical protein